jgi:hypothetical protein
MRKFEDITEQEMQDMELEFAPGCFDDFEGTQEELDQLVAAITAAFKSGEFARESRELTDEEFEGLSETTQLKLLDMTDPDTPNKRTLN